MHPVLYGVSGLILIRASLGKRLERERGESLATPHSLSLGNKEMKFSLKKV